MSRKRRKGKSQIPTGHLNLARRDEAREREILYSGIAKDPTIQEILGKIPSASELEALDMALHLQKVARPGAALLDNPEMSHIVSKMRENADKRDRAQQAWEEDQLSFIESTWDEAEKRKLTGSEAVAARERYEKASNMARASAKQNRMLVRKQREAQLRAEPTETIMVTGRPELQRVGKNLKMVIAPVEISIGHLKWVLPPGSYEVPKSVAARYRDMMSGQAEREARSNLLSAEGAKVRDEDEVRAEWQNLNQKTHTRADPFPVSGGVY